MSRQWRVINQRHERVTFLLGPFIVVFMNMASINTVMDCVALLTEYGAYDSHSKIMITLISQTLGLEFPVIDGKHYKGGYAVAARGVDQRDIIMRMENYWYG
jgi:hypothetical protein